MRSLLLLGVVLSSTAVSSACRTTGPGDGGSGAAAGSGGECGGGEDGGGEDDTGESPEDLDGDGYTADVDCDDTDPEVHPDAPERCNGLDDDCDEVVDDGLSAPWCLTGTGSCALQPEPPEHPAPLIHLAFEDPDHPELNEGSLDPAAWSLAGGEWSSGEGALGRALRIDKEGEGQPGNDYLYFPTHADLQVETFTFAAWVHPSYDATRMSIVNMIWDSAPAGLSFDLSYGFLSLRLGDGASVEALDTPVPSESWSHVAATYDGEQIALYVDGELRARQRVGTVLGGVDHYPAHFLVGAYQNPLYYAYDGLIDELMVWDRALSGEELRRDLGGARVRFESEGAEVDFGPLSLDEAEAEAGRERVCGPVGDAWTKEATETALELPAHRVLSPRPRLGLHLWVRPDLAQDAVLAEVDGAWSLAQRARDLELRVTCADGSEAALTAEEALSPTLWSEVDAAFEEGHLRLVVDGVERASGRAGCFELSGTEGPLRVGEGFAGGLDEVSAGPLPRSRARAARQVTWSAFDSRDPSAESTGLQDQGLLAADLGPAEVRLLTDDERYPCFHLQAATREACARSGGALEGRASLSPSGPLTLHGQVRPAEALAGAEVLMELGGVALWLGEEGLGLALDGGTPIFAGPAPEDRWLPVALALDHDEARLFVDGVLVASEPHALSEGGATQRFPLEAGALTWTSTEALAWLEDSGVDGFAWTEEQALARHAPWRVEARGLAVSSQLAWELADFDWGAVVDDLLAQHDAGSLDPEDETLSHYTRSNAAWYLAEAAFQSGETGEAFEVALGLLEGVDHGDWSWSWIHGRALYWYAGAYDRVAALLLELEATDPHTWSPRHAALRRRLASTLHHISVTGGINHDDPVLVDWGYYHPDPVYLAANSRLMSVGGTGHVALVMPAMADPDFGHAADHLELALDDLLHERSAGDEALGEQLRYFLHDSGLYVEGHGYQSDVFTGLTPFLVDWWQAGGEDHVTQGRVRAMYDANVAAMLPTGHAWPYATGWLQRQHHNPLVAEFLADSEPEAAEDYRWFAQRQYLEPTSHREPEWTSAVLGDEALILRSDWSEEALWLGLKGRTAPCPASHCQEDQLSLMLVAHGAWLLIDPGDGRSYRTTSETWKELWLQGAEGHNNVLVDGVGPGLSTGFEDLDDPAVLSVSLLSDRSDYGRMDGTIGEGVDAGGADHVRRVWLVDDAFFVLVDEVEAAGSATLSQQFHLGGPTSSGDGLLSTSGADFTWQTESEDGLAVDLDVVQLAPAGALSLAAYADGGTNFNYPLTWNHRYVHAQQHGSRATWMTLLLTGTASDPVPVATVLEESDSLRHAEVELASGEVLEVTWSGSGSTVAPGSASFDGVLAGTDGGTWAFMAEGSALEVSADLGAWSTCTLDALQLEVEGGALVGRLARPEDTACALELAWSGGAPASVEVDGVETSAWSHDAGAGAVVLDPAPGASFIIE